MGRAREVADRLTEAIVAWLAGFFEGFPDADYQAIAKHECGDVAIDEGFLVGTHTGTLSTPDGERIEPTGNAVRIRSCDVMEVRDASWRATASTPTRSSS